MSKPELGLISLQLAGGLMLNIRKELFDFSPYSPGLSIDEIKKKSTT